MDKMEYLFKTFCNRTKRKDRENYIINAIWNRLDNLAIKPITQQAIRNNNGDVYFIDLYFPQINVGVEVDEIQHMQTAEKDKIRDNEIGNSILENGKRAVNEILGAINEKAYKVYRIKTYNSEGRNMSCEEIHDNINMVVDKLKAEFDKIDLSVDWAKDSKDIIREHKYIDVKDRLLFKTIKDIRNTFNLEDVYSHVQRGLFAINELDSKYYIWCPHLNDPKWQNSIKIMPNGDILIYEKNNNDYTAKNRLTFMKSKDIFGDYYRFVGVYKFWRLENGYNVYKCESTTFKF